MTRTTKYFIILAIAIFTIVIETSNARSVNQAYESEGWQPLIDTKSMADSSSRVKREPKKNYPYDPYDGFPNEPQGNDGYWERDERGVWRWVMIIAKKAGKYFAGGVAVAAGEKAGSEILEKKPEKE